MPQINIYTYLSQITWTLILFFIILYLMKKIIFPTILENIIIINKYTAKKKINTLTKGNIEKISVNYSQSI